jgi:hypothetical protein
MSIVQYSPSPFVKQPLEEQLKHKSYPDLDQSDVDEAKEYEEDLGPGVAHALLATASLKECKGVVCALKEFDSIHLHKVGTGPSSWKDKPQRAILFGEVNPANTQPPVPTVAALQPNYLYEQHKKGQPNSADLFVAGLFCSPKTGLRPIHPRIIEFDFHDSHETPRKRIKTKDLDRGEALHGVEVKHVEKRKGYEDGWDKNWKEQTDEHMRAFIQSASQKANDRLRGEMEAGSVFRRRKMSELPIIHRFDDVNVERFHNVARAHCFSTYRKITPDDAGANVILNVGTDTIAIKEIQPDPEEVRRGLSTNYEGSGGLPEQSSP